MYKKRGMFVVLLLLVFLSDLVIADIDESKKVLALGAEFDLPSEPLGLDFDECAKGDALDCWGTEDLDGGTNVDIVGSYWAGIKIKPVGAKVGNCDDGTSHKDPPDQGCYIIFADDDSVFEADDDTAYSLVHEGYKVTNDYEQFPADNYGSHRICGEFGNENNALEGFNNRWARIKSANDPYICADDNHWYACNKDVVNQFITAETEPNQAEIDKSVFFCLKITENSETRYDWINTDDPEFGELDSDGDSVPDSMDCDPDDGNTHGSLGCRDEHRTNTYAKLTKVPAEPCKDSDACISGKNGVCDGGFCKYNVCTVPAADEICGDGINNDCLGIPFGSNDATINKDAAGDGSSSDNCDLNEDACLNRCVDPAGCSFLEDIGCCGDQGLADLGDIKKSGGPEYICLSKTLVGKDDGLDLDNLWIASGELAKEKVDVCKGDWCWVNADTAKFNIFTIKKPNEIYDVVANGNLWSACLNEGPLEQSIDLPNREQSNSFYCYQEGNHFSWAECSDRLGGITNEASFKERQPGDALYSLPLGGSATGTDPAIYDRYVTLDPGVTGFDQYYGVDYFDFRGYDNLEFFIKFVKNENGDPIENLALPAKVDLEILGPGDVPLIKTNVLGYTVSSAGLDSNEWIRIKFPLQGISFVNQLNLIGDDFHYIGVRNFYLTKDSGNLFCSGNPSLDENIWISDLDSSRGSRVCNAIFDPLYDPLTEGSGTAYIENMCCGDDGVNDFGTAQDAGCWRGKVLQAGNTTMDIEFEVTSNVSFTSPTTGSVTREVMLTLKDKDNPEYNHLDSVVSLTIDADSTTPQNITLVGYFDPFSFADSNIINEEILTIDEGKEQKVPVEVAIRKLVPRKATFTPTDKVKIEGFTEEFVYEISTENNEVIISNKQGDVISNLNLIETTSNLDLENGKAVFEIEVWITEIIEPPYLFNFDTAFENIILNFTHDPLYYAIASLGPLQFQQQSQSKTFSCSKSECIYPLPGLPPYTITNPNPHLYELWFVNQDGEFLITPTTEFTTTGNVVAKRISQQIIYESNQEALDFNFYGCQAESENLEKANYCTTKSGKFCSYESETGINSWSDETLTHIGYDLTSADNIIGAEYSLRETTAEEKLLPRNQSTSVLPARNIISNAEFQTDGQQMPHWEILTNNQLKTNVLQNIERDTNTITLFENEIMRSTRIAISSNTTFHFSQSGTCEPLINLVNKDGQSSEAELPEFHNDQASFLLIEFPSECTIKEPMLQVVDKFGPTNYSYTTQPQTNADKRTGAACCTQNSCWNGYSCVEEMSTYTFLSEHIESGRDYRCVEGVWESLPAKLDWQSDKIGFCQQATQCFVQQSTEGALPTNTAQTFYNNQIPTCLNDQEYVLDHYCDNGNWTSRTKFVASKLLEVADNDDYTIYCSDYRDALIKPYEDKEDFLGGLIVTSKSIQTGAGALLGETKTENVRTCFNLDKAGDLVKDDDNTCINNVCVIEHGGKIGFATTLNKPATQADSFITALGLDPNQISTACAGDEDFNECNLPGEIGYSEKLNAVFVNVDLKKSFLGNLVDTISDFFTGFWKPAQLENQKGFVNQAQNFNDIYLLNEDGKQVRAVRELFARNQTLIAEYENYQSPLCDYLQGKRIDHPELNLELLEEASGKLKINCTVNGDIQRVEAVNGLNFLWPQLTGKLR